MYLDNPRTNEEIKYVKEYIVQAYKFDSAFWVSEDDLLPYIQEFLDATLKSDAYIKGLKEKYSKLTSYDILARMWVIARYDDEGQIKVLKRDSRERKKQRHCLEQSAPNSTRQRKMSAEILREEAPRNDARSLFFPSLPCR